jgi:Arc/MetJ family transcription regulator
MRTNIDIDDKLMKQAMKATGAATKRAVVEAALQKLIQLEEQKSILKWRGKIQWEGDLDAMRENRFPDWHDLPRQTTGEIQKTAAPKAVSVP